MPSSDSNARDTAGAECPACGMPGGQAFYSAQAIPLRSNAVLKTQDEARRYPRGDLRLAFCPACGFISNTLFQADAANESEGYEATQAFSATFNAFTKWLAGGWIDRYQLQGKTAVEIGCGQGEFLAQMTALGLGAGIGFDPLFQPARHPAPQDSRLSFRRELFGPGSLTEKVDFICCRHTLEHIPAVGEFVRSLRQALTGSESTVVAFEVPDTLRVLHEGAFWDIYYEHCSYFTPGSLSRLFHSAGFDVLDYRLEYAGQYLVIEARPAPGPTSPRLPVAEDLAHTADAVRAFAAGFERESSRWSTLIRRAADAGGKVALWGSGSKAVGFLSTLGIGTDLVSCVVDINPHKHGTWLPVTAQPVVAPEHLRELKPALVIAMNPIYREEIRKELEQMGLCVELLTLR